MESLTVYRYDYEYISTATYDGITENEKVIRCNMWNQYFCSIKRYIHNQFSLYLTNIQKGDLYTVQLKELIHAVSVRKDIVNRSTF